MLIPYKYTKIAHLSSLFILLPDYALFKQKEYFMVSLNIMCYILTNMHWSNLKKDGLIREVDITVVLTNFIYSLYVAKKYTCYDLYYRNIIIIFCVFTINSIMDSYTIYNGKKTHFHYIRTCYTHCLFCHIFQGLNSFYVTNYCNN